MQKLPQRPSRLCIILKIKVSSGFTHITKSRCMAFSKIRSFPKAVKVGHLPFNCRLKQICDSQRWINQKPCSTDTNSPVTPCRLSMGHFRLAAQDGDWWRWKLALKADPCFWFPVCLYGSAETRQQSDYILSMIVAGSVSCGPSRVWFRSR